MTQALESKPVNAEIVDGSRQLAVELRSQRELALSQPRNESAIFKACLGELDLAPEFAEDAYYSIPFSSKSGDDGEKTMVEGLSVKAARAIVRRWSNCALGSRIVDEDGDSISVEGIFADFETNVFFRKLQRVPKTYIPRGTKIPVPLRSDRLNMAIQAGMGKAERNAALAALPEYLKERYFQTAKKIAGSKGKKEGKTDAQRMEDMIVAFAKFGIDKTRVESYMAAKFPKDANPDETLGTMRGIYNAIKDGQVKADEVFEMTKKDEPKAGAGPVSGAALTGASEAKP